MPTPWAIWSHLRGYVIIRVKGPHLESFLNQLSRRGIPIRDVERLGGERLVAKLQATHFRSLRRLSRGLDLQIAIVRKRGVPFSARRLWSRKGFLLGIAFALMATFAASSHIWFIQVDGIDRLSEEEVLSVIAGEGLRIGTQKADLELREIERQLAIEIPELAWTGITLDGVRATVRVAEKMLPDPNTQAPGNIVAAYDAVIESMTVFRGNGLVAEGDTVRRGQTLISGKLSPHQPTFAEQVREGKVPFVRADGVVLGRVWFEGYAEMPLYDVQEFRTGEERSFWQFRIGKWEGSIGGGRSPYDAHQRERGEIHRLQVGPLAFPIGWYRVKEYEVERIVKSLSVEEARRRAVEAAREDAFSQMPEEADVHSEDIITWESVEGDQTWVRARVTFGAFVDIRGFQAVDSRAAVEG